MQLCEELVEDTTVMEGTFDFDVSMSHIQTRDIWLGGVIWTFALCLHYTTIQVFSG